MKTYILRDLKTVERQNPLLHPWRPDPAITATVVLVCGRPTAAGTVRGAGSIKDRREKQKGGGTIFKNFPGP